MDDLVEFVAETDSRLMSLIEESAEDSTLSEVAEGGKVKSKDIQEKMDEIMSHVHTPLIDGLVKLQGMLPMKKKEYVAYINDNIILEVAYTEKGTVTKASVAYALAMARAEAKLRMNLLRNRKIQRSLSRRWIKNLMRRLVRDMQL